MNNGNKNKATLNKEIMLKTHLKTPRLSPVIKKSLFSLEEVFTTDPAIPVLEIQISHSKRHITCININFMLLFSLIAGIFKLSLFFTFHLRFTSIFLNQKFKFKAVFFKKELPSYLFK